MYCTNCGKELKEGIRFCPGCGTRPEPKANEMETITTVSSSTQNTVKKDLEKSLEVIITLENALNKKDEFDIRRKNLEKERQEIISALTPLQMWLFVLGIPIAIIMTNFETEFTFFGGLVLYSISYYVIFFAIVNKIIIITSRKSREEKGNQYYNEHIVAIDKEEAEFIESFQAYCTSNDFNFAQRIVPQEYFDSDSVRFFIKMIDSHRADSFKEAVNLYEEYLYRVNMENLQMQQLKETQQLSQNINTQMNAQTIYMQQISRNTQATAQATKLNAFITATVANNLSN